MEILEGDGVTAARGFRAAGVACGIKAQGLDLSVLESTVPAVCAAVFTKNVVQAAPVTYTREVVASGGRVRALVVNSGNANACTGAGGLQDARRMALLTERRLGIEAE